MRKLNGIVSQKIQRGRGPNQFVLLLTTTGRKSGQPRVTPLQYEIIDGAYFIGSARGVKADWFCNILVDPSVSIQDRGDLILGEAFPITNPERVADLLEVRLRRHPWMIGLLLRLEGLPIRYRRSDLERIASKLAYVRIEPVR